MLIKIIIGVFSIFACVYVGKKKAESYKNSVDFYESLVLFNNKFYEELFYSKKTLKQLYSITYKSDSFNEMLKILYTNNNDIEKINCPSFINENEFLTVKDYFSGLGKTDSSASKQFSKTYKEIFYNVLNIKRENSKKYYSLFIKLGFMGGLALFIMVI